MIDSGKFFFGNNNNYLWYYATEMSTDVHENYSVVDVHMWFGAQYNSAMWGAGSTPVNITVNGSTKKLWIGDFSLNGNYNDIGTARFYVYHNSDGTGSASISVSCNLGSFSGVYFGSTSHSSTLPLTTIHRASKISSVVADGGGTMYLGSPVRATISAASTSFTHRVWYRVNGSSWVEVSASGNKAVFTPPLSYASSAPNSPHSTLDVSIETLSGGKRVGNYEYSYGNKIYLNGYKPSIGSIEVTEQNTAVSNLVEKAGYAVAGYSKLTATQKNITTHFGETVTSEMSYRYNGGDASGMVMSSTIRNVVPKTTGTLTFTGGVKGSRGSYTTKSTNITVLPYDLPKLSFRLYRSGGGTGNRALMNINASISSVSIGSGNLNSGTVKVWYKPAGGSWTGENSPQWSKPITTSISVSSVDVGGTFELDQTYVFWIQVSDALGKTYYIYTLPTAQYPMVWGKRSIGVGMIPSDTPGVALEVGGEARIYRSGAALSIRSQTHAYQEIFVGDERKAWFGFGDVGSKYFSICNEYTGKKLSLQENGRLGYNGTAELDGLWIGNRNIGDVGTIIWGNSTGTSMLSGVWTDHRTITLSKGIWIVDCGYVANQTGKYLDYELKGLPFGFIAGTLYCQDGNDHSSTSHGVVNLDKTTTITLRAWSSNGMTSAKNHYVRATKIIGY